MATTEVDELPAPRNAQPIWPAEQADAAPAQFTGGARLLSAQLTRLEFIRRCVEEAEDPAHPLLERLRFLAISHQRIDEFFEIDVSGLRALREGVQAGTAGLLPDGTTVTEALTIVRDHLAPLMDEREQTWKAMHQELAASGIHILTMGDLDGGQREAARLYFERQVFPVLTPLAVDPAHPFPHISDRKSTRLNSSH